MSSSGGSSSSSVPAQKPLAEVATRERMRRITEEKTRAVTEALSCALGPRRAGETRARRLVAETVVAETVEAVVADTAGLEATLCERKGGEEGVRAVMVRAGRGVPSVSGAPARRRAARATTVQRPQPAHRRVPALLPARLPSRPRLPAALLLLLEQAVLQPLLVHRALRERAQAHRLAERVALVGPEEQRHPPSPEVTLSVLDPGQRVELGVRVEVADALHGHGGGGRGCVGAGEAARAGGE